MLPVLFLMPVNNPPSCFSILSLSRRIYASTLSSMLPNPFPPSFLDTYSLSTSSLACNALIIVISFLVLWSICLSSSLVHFRKGLEYLTKGTAKVFILLVSFRQESFVSSSFLVLLRYSFFNFVFHFQLFDGVSLRDAQVFVGFLFSEHSNLVLIW